MKIDVFYLRVICTCDQCDSPFCALQLTALIKLNWCVPRYCCACLHHSLIVVQPSWTTVPCPTTKLSLLISKSFVEIKQNVISVAFKTPLKTKLGICIYKTSLPHRPEDYIGFTSSCPPHILQQIAPMHSQTAMSRLCKQERKRPTPVQRRLRRTHAVLVRVIPGGGCRCRRWKCGDS